jgi:hypothetical protein
MKLKNAVQATAMWDERTRVDTDRPLAGRNGREFFWTSPANRALVVWTGSRLTSAPRIQWERARNSATRWLRASDSKFDAQDASLVASASATPCWRSERKRGQPKRAVWIERTILLRTRRIPSPSRTWSANGIVPIRGKPHVFPPVLSGSIGIGLW